MQKQPFLILSLKFDKCVSLHTIVKDPQKADVRYKLTLGSSQCNQHNLEVIFISGLFLSLEHFLSLMLHFISFTKVTVPMVYF